MSDTEDKELTAEEKSCMAEFERKLGEVGKKRRAIFDNIPIHNMSWVMTPEHRRSLEQSDLEYEAVFDWLRDTLPDRAPQPAAA